MRVPETAAQSPITGCHHTSDPLATDGFLSWGSVNLLEQLREHGETFAS